MINVWIKFEMFPTKTEYLELQKLLPKSDNWDICQSPYSVNRSSSSADSLSPESLFDSSLNTRRQFTDNSLFTESPQHSYARQSSDSSFFETPPHSTNRNQRLFDNSLFFESPQQRNISNQSFDNSFFESPHSDMLTSPYRLQEMTCETPFNHETPMQNRRPESMNQIDSHSGWNPPVFDITSMNHQRPILGRKILPTNPLKEKWPKPYELFPVERQVTEFDMPSQQSPVFESHGSVGNLPKVSRITNPILFDMAGPSSGIQEAKVCAFCKKNGERPQIFGTHAVKEKVGKKYVVTCPILREHVCATCGATGDNAHTITYCPVLRSSNNGEPLRSTAITLKTTKMKSNGKLRYS